MRKRWITIAVILCVCIISFCFLTRSSAIDPDQVAKAETKMWQAYYTGDRMELGKQLMGVLQGQWGLSFNDARVVGQSLAKASMTFSKTRGNYDKLVLGDLIDAYTKIKQLTGKSFDPEAAARAELAWWVARRTPGENSPEQVGQKISELYTVLHGCHHPAFDEAGFLRAKAAKLRDDGGTNADWEQIEQLLRRSYGKLLTV